MEIKTLSITNFGKFSNKTINLSPGLNLIEGLNETGKTTIHAFIEAILYGFYDRNVKVRRLLSAYHRYVPNQGVYGGSITLTLNQIPYRIERDLTKGLDQDLRIYNDKTGKDLTATLDIDPILKTVDMEKFLDMPYRLYQNTLSIKQMAAETSKDAEGDLYNKIKNLLSSQNDLLRPHLALEKLKKEKDAIGTTSKTSKKPFALTIKKIEALTQEKTQTLAIHETVLEDKEALEKQKQARHGLQTKLNQVKTQLAQIENTLAHARYNKIKTLKNDAEKLTDKQKELAAYKMFKETDLDTARQTEQTILLINDKIKTLQSTLASKEASLTTLLKDIHPDVQQFDTIAEDAVILNRAYRAMNENAIQTLHQSIKTVEASISPLKENLIIQETKRKKHKKRWFLLVPLAFLLITKIKIRTIHKKLAPLNKKLTELTTELAIESAPKDTVLTYLNKYNQPTIEAFDAYYKTLEKSHHLNTQALTIKRELKTHQEDLTQLKDTLRKEKDTLKTRLDTYHVSTLNELITYQKNHQKYQDIDKEITHLTKEINALLGTQSFEALSSSIDFDQPLVSTDNQSTLKSTYDTLLSEINTLDKEITQRDKLIDTTLAKVRDIETIDYELTQARKSSEHYQTRLDIITQAMTYIENAKAAIEENFAPLLSDTIATYVSTLTNQTYKTIKVSKTLDFKVIDPITNQLKTPAHFSSGTKDQIYLAMRLGILKTLNYDHYPLFFDDVFVTYDSTRLNSALDLLLTLSKERQLVIFTCHARERTYLKDKPNTTLITL